MDELAAETERLGLYETQEDLPLTIEAEFLRRCRKFKAATGRSVQGYLADWRLGKLSDTDESNLRAMRARAVVQEYARKSAGARVDPAVLEGNDTWNQGRNRSS